VVVFMFLFLKEDHYILYMYFFSLSFSPGFYILIQWLVNLLPDIFNAKP